MLVNNKMLECSRCLYTYEHPFGLTFDSNGCCSGCLIHDEKDTLDWDARLNELQSIVKPYRSKQGNHDCIIHIDGTAQSYYVVHLATEVLGLNPLLVNYNSHFLTDVGIKNIAQLITRFDKNFFQYTTAPADYINLVKHSIQKLNSVYWPYLAGKTSLPYRLAAKMKIPLVINGACQTVEQVGMFSHTDNIEYSRWYRKQHDLLGVDESDFLTASGSINENLFDSLRYPDDEDINDVGIRGIFLSNYIRWDPFSHNIEMLRYGFTPQSNKRSFDTFENAGCSVYFGIHDILRKITRGYSKAREHLSREIRFGHISKENAIIYYNHYLAVDAADDANSFFDWLQVGTEGRYWLMEILFQQTDMDFLLKNKSNSEIILPKQFNEFRTNAKPPVSLFKLFGKGI